MKVGRVSRFQGLPPDLKKHFVDPTNARHFLTHAQTRFGLGTRTSAVDGNWKFPGLGERLHAKNCCLVPQRGRTREKHPLKDGVNWQTSNAILQSLNSLVGRPSFQGGRTGNALRIVHSMLANCLSKCVHMARTGRRDIPWSVNKLASSNHQMDRSL